MEGRQGQAWLDNRMLQNRWPGNQGAGGWMPGWQRRLRSPGFVVGTEAGAWLFDGPQGPKRAEALSARFGIA